MKQKKQCCNCVCDTYSLLSLQLWYLQFVKFANIEEDTPSYHRRYDFFVSKFSAMCHSGSDSDANRSKYVTENLLKHLDKTLKLRSNWGPK